MWVRALANKVAEGVISCGAKWAGWMVGILRRGWVLILVGIARVFILCVVIGKGIIKSFHEKHFGPSAFGILVDCHSG